MRQSEQAVIKEVTSKRQEDDQEQRSQQESKRRRTGNRQRGRKVEKIIENKKLPLIQNENGDERPIEEEKENV